MGQTCQKNTNKNHKQIKVPVIEPPYGIVEEGFKISVLLF